MFKETKAENCCTPLRTHVNHPQITTLPSTRTKFYHITPRIWYRSDSSLLFEMRIHEWICKLLVQSFQNQSSLMRHCCVRRSMDCSAVQAFMIGHKALSCWGRESALLYCHLSG